MPPPRDVLLREVADIEGLLCLLTDRIDEELLAAAPRLKVVSQMAVGVDNIDVAACTRRSIPVGNTPGVLTETTADLAWALLMATARRIVEAEAYTRSGAWKTWEPMGLLGRDVHHATLGIIGLGAIGAAVARRARGFDMRIFYSSRRRKPELEAELSLEYREMDEVLKESDFVSLHCALTPETRHLIGPRELALMKPTAILINTTRGPVVDQAALAEALKAGTIAAAGLDVFEVEPVPLDDPILALPNVVALPHIGSASVATRGRMARMAADNLLAALAGRRPPNLVNPEVWTGR
jgi:glyoxylate reductase